MSEAQYRERASEIYATDDVQVYEDAAVSEADGGCWVAAWVWVSDESVAIYPATASPR